MSCLALIANSACVHASPTVPARALVTDRIAPLSSPAEVSARLRQDGWHKDHAFDQGHAVIEEWSRSRFGEDRRLGLVFDRAQLRAATLYVVPRGGLPPGAAARLFDRWAVELDRRFGTPSWARDGYAVWVGTDGTRVALIRDPDGVIEAYRFPGPPVSMLARLTAAGSADLVDLEQVGGLARADRHTHGDDHLVAGL